MELWEDFNIVNDSDQEEEKLPPYHTPPTNGRCCTEELPSELLRVIFGDLPLEDHSFVVPAVNKRWRATCQLRMGHKLSPNNLLLLEDGQYVVTVQPNRTVLMWGLAQERAIEKMGCGPYVYVGLGGVVEVLRNSLLIYKPFEDPVSLHFPHTDILILKDRSIIGVSSTSRTKYTLNPYTEWLTVHEPDIPCKNIITRLFPDEQYAYTRSSQHLIIFKTSNLKRVCSVDLTISSLCPTDVNFITASEDGCLLCLSDGIRVVFFSRPAASKHLPESIAAKMWTKLSTCREGNRTLVWNKKMNFGLIKRMEDVFLVKQSFVVLFKFSDYSGFCWVSSDTFCISNKTQLELYRIKEEGDMIEPVLLQKTQNIDTEHISKIKILSSKYLATVNGYNNVIVWETEKLTTKFRLTGNIIQGGKIVKLDNEFFAIYCQDHIIVHKIGRFGSTHMYSIPHTKEVYKVEGFNGKAYALVSKGLIVWEIHSGRVLRKYDLSSLKIPQPMTTVRFTFLDDGTLAIDVMSINLYFNEIWSKGDFEHFNEVNLYEEKKEKVLIWNDGGGFLCFMNDTYVETLFHVLYRNKLHLIHHHKIHVFDWKTKRLESVITTNHFNYNSLNLFHQEGTLTTYHNCDFNQFDVSNLSFRSMEASHVDIVKDLAYVEKQFIFHTVDIKQFSIRESFDAKKLKLEHFNSFLVLDGDIVAVFRSSRVFSFPLKEDANLKLELSGVNIKHSSQVCASDDRKVIAIQTSQGLHIGTLCPHPTQPFLSWRFIEIDSDISPQASLFYSPLSHTFVLLTKHTTYTYYIQQQVGFHTLALL